MEQLIKRTKNIKYVKDICDNVILMHPKISEGCQILNVFSLVLFFFFLTKKCKNNWKLRIIVYN